MSNLFKKIICGTLRAVFTLTIFSLAMQPVLASSPFTSEAGNKMIDSFMGANVTKESYSELTLSQKIGDIIKVILEFIGVLVLVIIIYAGFLWLTAGGNQEQVTKARKWLVNAFIGALIIGLAYALTAFVLTITQQ